MEISTIKYNPPFWDELPKCIPIGYSRTMTINNALFWQPDQMIHFIRKGQGRIEKKSTPVLTFPESFQENIEFLIII